MPKRVSEYEYCPVFRFGYLYNMFLGARLRVFETTKHGVEERNECSTGVKWNYVLVSLSLISFFGFQQTEREYCGE